MPTATTNSITLPPIDLLGAAAAENADEAQEALDIRTLKATNKAQLQLIDGTVPIPVNGVVHRINAALRCLCEAG